VAGAYEFRLIVAVPNRRYRRWWSTIRRWSPELSPEV